MVEPADDSTEPGTASWWAAHRVRLNRRRPRPGGLSIERIVEVAVDLMDRDGVDRLTVRSLAEALDTSSASLYRHVASTDELAVLAIDHVLGEVVLPIPSLTGRARVVGLAKEFRRVLGGHPGVVPVLRSSPLAGPNAMRGVDDALAGLDAMGFAPQIAAVACIALIDYVLGSVFFDMATAGDGGDEGDLDSDEVFDLALAAFLDGLESGHPINKREH